jgi:hypothetical protein
LSCQIDNINIDLKLLKKECEDILFKKKLKAHPGDHSGGWGSIGLITYGGNEFNDLVDHNLKIMPTKILDMCPSIIKLLNEIPGKKHRVRIMEVKPGSKVNWHYDNNESIDELDFKKNVRLHMPIFTNPEVEMKICHENISWHEGKLYYADFSFPHFINNKSKLNRIHLVIDVGINNDIINLIPKKFLEKRKLRLMVKKYSQRLLNLYKKFSLLKKY